MISRPIRVLEVTDHLCTRVVKQATLLKGIGFELEAACNGMHAYINQFDIPRIYFTPEQLRNHILDSNADILHCHNEPDAVVKAACDHAAGRPVIFDVHDQSSLYMGYIPFDEVECFSKADGFVFVGVKNKQVAEEIYPQIRDKENVVAWSCQPLENFIPDEHIHAKPDRLGVVYSGALAQMGRDFKTYGRFLNPGEGFTFRDYGPVFFRLRSLGIPVQIYTGSTDCDVSGYASIGCSIETIYGEQELVAAIGQHAWGLVGFPGTFKLGKVAMPNKFFDCMAAGIPVLALNVPEVEKIVEATGTGISLTKLGVENWHLLPSLMAEKWAQCRTNVLLNRKRFCGQTQIMPIINMYNKLLNVKGVKTDGMSRIILASENPSTDSGASDGNGHRDGIRYGSAAYSEMVLSDERPECVFGHHEN